MKNTINKASVISSIIWKFLEGCGAQGAQFAVQLVLARLLSPKDYSVIAVTIIFITVANVFVQSGFSSALVQRKETDSSDFSSVFYLSLSAAGLLYLVLFFTSPYIAKFYGDPQIVPVLRVLSATLFLGAFNSVQKAYIARNMLFKKLFLSSIIATLLSGAAGIILAYLGYGVWALAIQQLLNQLLVNILLLITVKWRPVLKFSAKKLRSLFAFGSRILASALIDTLYNNLRSLIIGKIYSPTMLSFYNRGDQFPSIIISNINGSIQSVMLPALASQQDKSQRVKEMMRRSIVTSTFIIFPMMAGLAAAAEPMVRFLLTDKWLPCVPFIRILSISYALWPIHTANLQAINAMGRSDIFLRLEFIKKIISITILIVSIRFGVYAIVWGALLCSIISSFINVHPNLKLLNYSYKEQCLDILPGFLMSLVMGLAVSGLIWLHMACWITLILQVSFGIILYLSMAIVFRLESYTYLSAMLKGFMKEKKFV